MQNQIVFVEQPKKEKRKYMPYWMKIAKRVREGEITEEEYQRLLMKHKEKLDKRRQYIKGNRIDSFEELIKILLQGGFVWMFDKPTHASFVESLQFRCLLNMLYGGKIFTAKKKKADDG